MKELIKCHDCGAMPGQIHKEGCDVEKCSVCGGQRLTCACEGHDPSFSRWTGIWPGRAEADYLEVDLNQFYAQEFYKIFFIKPKERKNETGKEGDE